MAEVSFGVWGELGVLSLASMRCDSRSFLSKRLSSSEMSLSARKVFSLISSLGFTQEYMKEQMRSDLTLGSWRVSRECSLETICSLNDFRRWIWSQSMKIRTNMFWSFVTVIKYFWDGFRVLLLVL